MEFLQEAKKASSIIAQLSTREKNRILLAMAQALVANTQAIEAQNRLDMEAGSANGLSTSMMDRLFLDAKRIEAMAQAIREIATLPDPVGRVLDGWVNEDELKIEKVSVPIGVIGIIYESRPNVTSDTAALCFKSGNACILKGGKEAQHSNTIIADMLQSVLVANALPKAIIALLPDTSREGVAHLVKQDKYVDLIIPRGGEALIRFVNENATVPVIKHDKGVCHIYVDKEVDLAQALPILHNAKVQRPGVCNAMETMLVDSAVAHDVLPPIKAMFDAAGTQLRGCARTRAIIEVGVANDEDFHTEHLANKLNIRIVDGVEGAIEHIATYGSGHSEAILTRDYATANRFIDSVDASACYINASTRFTDGGQFGFGAEVGISTSKLHARGPMGIEGLTTYKFKIYGSGQIRR
ncbi:MAG: gamma-glutamyl phosphate reductase [Sulfuricurvum sp. PC08-66]|nr:MAG: gamma-glutamyl phosphate reductase [Sulfuricurvum sp. PC08-66]